MFTHNSQGEYGNEHHKLVHQCVIEHIGNPNTWVFISPGSTNVNQENLRSKITDGNFKLDLPSEILKQKVDAFQKCHVTQSEDYGYDLGSGKLKNTQLEETLYWYFENPRREEYTFFR